MSTVAYFVVEASCRGCDAEISLNGIPLFVLRRERCADVAIPVNHLVVPADTELCAVVQPGPSPARVLHPGETASSDGMEVRILLSRYPHGAIPGEGDGVPLLRLSWTGSGDVQFPLRITHRGDVEGALGGWRWLSADRLVPGCPERPEVIDYLRRLHGLLSRRKLDALWQEAAEFNRELGAAFGQPVGVREAEFWALWREEFDKPEHAMTPWREDEIELRYCAGDRLVQPLRSDWSPALITSPDADGNRAAYPVFLGRVNGSFCVMG